jgi:hypothetical protein
LIVGFGRDSGQGKFLQLEYIRTALLNCDRVNTQGGLFKLIIRQLLDSVKFIELEIGLSNGVLANIPSAQGARKYSYRVRELPKWQSHGNRVGLEWQVCQLIARFMQRRDYIEEGIIQQP